MSLLIAFVICLLVGQTISVTIGLIIEYFTTSHTSLLAFVPLYFGMFWIAWKVAVRITEPSAPEAAQHGAATMSPARAAATPRRDAHA